MAHLVRDKKKLLLRVHRIQGQIAAVEKALEEEQDCGVVLQRIAACRGAFDSLMAEVIENHVRTHVLPPDEVLTSDQATAAEELISVIRTYLR